MARVARHALSEGRALGTVGSVHELLRLAYRRAKVAAPALNLSRTSRMPCRSVPSPGQGYWQARAQVG